MLLQLTHQEALHRAVELEVELLQGLILVLAGEGGVLEGMEPVDVPPRIVRGYTRCQDVPDRPLPPLRVSLQALIQGLQLDLRIALPLQHVPNHSLLRTRVPAPSEVRSTPASCGVVGPPIRGAGTAGARR